MSALRHELKYLISDGTAALLETRLPLVMARDAHAGANGRYFVRSLYFDDAEYSFQADKLAGTDARTKFRLRLYNGDESRVLFEKKEKLGGLCRKTSVRVSREVAEAMTRGDVESLPRGEPLLDEFRALTSAALLRPVVLVDYDRAAFAYPVSNARVTLDLDVRCAAFGGQSLFGEPRSFLPAMEPGEQILEVKFDELLASRVNLALAGIPAQRMAISKYCKCLSMLI